VDRQEPQAPTVGRKAQEGSELSRGRGPRLHGIAPEQGHAGGVQHFTASLICGHSRNGKSRNSTHEPPRFQRRTPLTTEGPRFEPGFPAPRRKKASRGVGHLVAGHLVALRRPDPGSDTSRDGVGQGRSYFSSETTRSEPSFSAPRRKASSTRKAKPTTVPP